VLNEDFQLFVYAINNDREFELGVGVIPTMYTVGSNYEDDILISGTENFDSMKMTGRKTGDCYCEVIGRINVKQDSDYNWVEPSNIYSVNKPIHETDWINYENRIEGVGSLEVNEKTVNLSKFKITGDMLNVDSNVTGIKTLGVANNSFYLNVPFDPKEENVLVGKSRVKDSTKKEPNPNSKKSEVPGAGNKILIETDNVSSGEGIEVSANLYYNYV